MKITGRMSALGTLVFAIGALMFLSAPIASFSTTVTQEQTTNATSPEGAPEGEARYD